MDKTSPNQLVIDFYNVKSAAKISGLSEHMIGYLRRYGIVTASGSKVGKRGVALKYTYTDILLLRVISRLLTQGISPLRLRKSLNGLQKRGHKTGDLISKKYVATDGRDIFIVGNDIVELLESGQLAFAFILELGAIRDEVAERILAA